ncbi:MAG: 50S ribosomal protein L19 [Elusimicrobia bacterium]|nr:50S ribosomal protein L19 [Elusimicrobiota bacterium]
MVAEKTKKTTPKIKPGDTVKVHLKVVEGESERIQVFEGTVIRFRGIGDSQSFTVRKISFGVGVERTFPVVSPHIERIEFVRTGRVRRSRLYYLRGLTGKAARLGEDEARETAIKEHAKTLAEAGPKGQDGAGPGPAAAPPAQAAPAAAA